MTAATAPRSNAALSFENATALLFDPIPANRATTRTALGMLGFRQLTATSAFEEVQQLLRGRLFDLFVADVTHETAKACGMVRLIREGRQGANPFMHILLMAWKLEGDLVQRALSCGADDLVTRPFSVDFLGARIRAHAEMQKQFVVTSDYIGPDRRKNRTARGPGTLIDVPNTLFVNTRHQLADQPSPATVADDIKEASIRIDAERARRDAFQIAFLLRFLRESLTTAAPMENDLKRLEVVAKDLVDRVHGEESDVVQKLTTPLIEEAARALGGQEVAAHLDKMDEFAAGLLETLNPGRARAELLQDVEAAVQAVKARGRKDQNTA